MWRIVEEFFSPQNCISVCIDLLIHVQHVYCTSEPCRMYVTFNNLYICVRQFVGFERNSDGPFTEDFYISILFYPTSSILHPASCILHPESYILHTASYIQHPTSYIKNISYPTQSYPIHFYPTHFLKMILVETKI